MRLVTFVAVAAFSPGAGADQDDRGVTGGTWAEPGAAVVDLREFLDVSSALPKDMPSRGQIVVDGGDLERFEMPHWEERSGSLETSRNGRYELWLHYTLARASLGVQCRVAEARIKGLLRGGNVEEGGRQEKFGVVELSGPGTVPIRILTPLVDFPAGFVVHELRLVPTRGAGEDGPVAVGSDGSMTLSAVDATTWSTALVYQADQDGGILRNWTEAEDFAEWRFATSGPENFRVALVYRCTENTGGSVVEVRSGAEVLEFALQPTGQPGAWSEVEIGQLAIPVAGDHRLKLQPKTMQGAEMMELKELILRPGNRSAGLGEE